MKKIIWITYIALTVLWTGLVALSLQLSEWLLSLISTAQIPNSADVNVIAAHTPAWAAPWIDATWLQSLTSGLTWAITALNQTLPALNSLGSWITVFGWLVWGLIAVALFIVALVLHWLVNKYQRSSASTANTSA